MKHIMGTNVLKPEHIRSSYILAHRYTLICGHKISPNTYTHKHTGTPHRLHTHTSPEKNNNFVGVFTYFSLAIVNVIVGSCS